MLMKPKSNLQPRRRGTKASDEKPMELLVDKDLEWVKEVAQEAKAQPSHPKPNPNETVPPAAVPKPGRGRPRKETAVPNTPPAPVLDETLTEPKVPQTAQTPLKRKRGRPRKEESPPPTTSFVTASAPTWPLTYAAAKAVEAEANEAEASWEAAPPSKDNPELQLNRQWLKAALASGEVYDLHRYLAENIYKWQIPLPKRPYPKASGVFYKPEKAEWALSNWEMENHTPEGLFKVAYLRRRPLVERVSERGRPMLRAFVESEVKAAQLLDLHPILFAYLGDESIIQSKGEGFYIDGLQLQEIMRTQGHTLYSLNWLSGGILDFDVLINLVLGHSMIGGLSKDKREILNAILNLPNVFEEEIRIDEEQVITKASSEPQAVIGVEQGALEEDPEVVWLRGKDYKERLELSLAAMSDLQSYVQQVLEGLSRPPLEELVTAMQQVIKLGAMTPKQGEEAIAKLKLEAQRNSQSFSITQEGLKAKAQQAQKLLAALQDDPSDPS